jgi:hypothetical protein
MDADWLGLEGYTRPWRRAVQARDVELCRPRPARNASEVVRVEIFLFKDHSF